MATVRRIRGLARRSIAVLELMVESRRPAVLVFGQNGPYVNEFWSLIHYLARHLLLLEERRIELGQLR